MMKKRVQRKWALRLAVVFLWGTLSPAWAGPLKILLPRPGDLVGGENILCIAEFKSSRRPITKVDFLVDDQVLTALRYQPPAQQATATFIWDAREVSDGTHRLTVRAYAGSTIVGMDTITINVSNAGNDIVPPQVHIYFPHPDSVVSGTTEIGIQATDNRGVAMVTLFIDKQLKLLQNFPPYRYQWDTTLYPNGPHEIEVWAYDSAQNKGEARPIRVFVNNPAGRTDLKEIKEGIPSLPQKPSSEQPKALQSPARREISKASPSPPTPSGLSTEKKVLKPSSQKPQALSYQQERLEQDGGVPLTAPRSVKKTSQPPSKPQPQEGPPTKKTPSLILKPREGKKASPKDGQSSLAQPPAVAVSPPTPPIPRIPQALKREPQMTPPVQPTEEARPVVVEPRVTRPKLPETALKEEAPGSSMPTKELKPIPSPVKEEKVRRSPRGLREEMKIPLRKAEEGISLQQKNLKPSPEIPRDLKPSSPSKVSEQKPVPLISPPQMMEAHPRPTKPSLSSGAGVSPSVSQSKRTATPPNSTPSSPVQVKEVKRPLEGSFKGKALVARLPKRESLGKPFWEEGPYRLRATPSVAPGLLKIALNDQPLDLDIAPWIQDGLTMVPFRQIFEHSGGVVLWLPAERVVRAYRPGTQVEIKIGSPVGFLNGEKVIMDRPAFIKQGRTIVTLRFVATALNLHILYDPERNLVRLFRP